MSFGLGRLVAGAGGDVGVGQPCLCRDLTVRRMGGQEDQGGAPELGQSELRASLTPRIHLLVQNWSSQWKWALSLDLAVPTQLSSDVPVDWLTDGFTRPSGHPSVRFSAPFLPFMFYCPSSLFPFFHPVLLFPSIHQ